MIPLSWSFAVLRQINEFCFLVCSLPAVAWWWFSFPFCAWCDAIFFLRSSTSQMWFFEAFVFQAVLLQVPLCHLHFQMLSIILTAPKKWTSYFNTSSNRIFVSALMKCGLDIFICCMLLLASIPSNVNAFFVSALKGVYKEEGLCMQMKSLAQSST